MMPNPLTLIQAQQPKQNLYPLLLLEFMNSKQRERKMEATLLHVKTERETHRLMRDGR